MAHVEPHGHVDQLHDFTESLDGFFVAGDEKQDVAGGIDQREGDGHAVSPQHGDVAGGDKFFLFVEACCSGEEARDVAIGAQAKQNQIELGQPSLARGERRADQLLVFRHRRVDTCYAPESGRAVSG